MGDSLNALLQGQRAGSVLEGIAHPAVVNPLAAITAGTQAAGQVYDVRAKQAQQAIGQIIQQATDENGNVDWQNAHKAAAAAGPIVQMGMAKFAGEASELKGQQLSQASAAHSFLGTLAISAVQDPSDENMANIRAQAVNANAPPQVIAEIDRIRGLPMAQRSQVSLQHVASNLDALNKLHVSTGNAPIQLDTGGGTQGAGVDPLTGAIRTRGPLVPRTPTPGEALAGGYHYQATQADIDAGRATTLGQDIYIPGAEIYRRAGLPIPPGLLPPARTGSAPSVTPPPPPAGNPPPRAARPPPGTRSSLEGGVPVASADSQIVPATGTPGAPSSAVAGDVADIQAGMAGARGSPRPPGTQTAWNTIATGPGVAEAQGWKADTDAYLQDKATVPDVMTRAQNMAKAYQALRLLKEMDSSTGVGAAGWQAFRSRMGTLGLQTDTSKNVQQQQEEFAKYTERLMLDAAGGSSTNLGKQMAAQSNPGNVIGMSANFDFLRNDLGKTLQAVAAQMSHDNKSGPGYLSHRADIATKTDPRGFAWNTYDDDEKAKIMADAKRDGDEAVKRLKRAIGLSHQLDLTVPGATQPPPPDKRSMIMPPGPQVNALSMAG